MGAPGGWPRPQHILLAISVACLRTSENTFSTTFVNKALRQHFAVDSSPIDCC